MISKRRTAQQKYEDRLRHLIRKHHEDVEVLAGHSYFTLGVRHATLHIRKLHEDALKHNA